jgi:hypothetical protein
MDPQAASSRLLWERDFPVAVRRLGWEAPDSNSWRRDSAATMEATRAGLGLGDRLGDSKSLSDSSIIGILEGLRDPWCFFQECSAWLQRSQTHLNLSVNRLNVDSRPLGGGRVSILVGQPTSCARGGQAFIHQASDDSYGSFFLV